MLAWSILARAEGPSVAEKPIMDQFSLSSPVFHNGGPIPEHNTCKGADTNPTLSIHNIPKGTKSMVLTVREPDNPITPWTNWLVYNIDPGTREVKEGAVPGTQALNDFGNFYYGGPCPFDAKRRHYVFTVYALNDTLDDVNEGATFDIVEKAMKNKIIDKAVLVGIYQNPLWDTEDTPL
jgi:Raf kinase inhibitor-like YbhB/YbcL family protein